MAITPEIAAARDEREREPVYTHVEDGGTYRRTGQGLMKVDATGAWVEAVQYVDASRDNPHAGQVYFTSSKRWNEKFKLK